jgi:hypothetical protein
VASEEEGDHDNEDDEEEEEEGGGGGEEEGEGEEETVKTSRLVTWRKDVQDLGAVLDPEWLRKLINRWKEQCVLCRIRGRVPRGHRC